MPPLLILAIVVGCWLLGAPDRFTLRATRGTAGAISGAIRGGGVPARSGSARPAPRATRPGSGKTRTPTRIGPPRPSRIAAGIRGGIRAADQAEARRGDLLAAIREWRARIHDRRQDRIIRAAEDQAHDENDRRDRAAKRDRIRTAVKPIAAAYPPAPPARPKGEPVPQTPDLTNITLTELDTLDHLGSEVSDAADLVAGLTGPVDEVHAYLRSLSERYTGAGDLWKTGQMDTCIALLDERNFNALRNELDKAAEQLETLMKAIEKAKNDVKESDAKSGRVETARAS